MAEQQTPSRASLTGEKSLEAMGEELFLACQGRARKNPKLLPLTAAAELPPPPQVLPHSLTMEKDSCG